MSGYSPWDVEPNKDAREPNKRQPLDFAIEHLKAAKQRAKDVEAKLTPDGPWHDVYLYAETLDVVLADFIHTQKLIIEKRIGHKKKW